MLFNYLLPLILLTITLSDISSQAINDLCENAKEIDGALFIWDSIYYGNDPIGIPREIIGKIYDSTLEASSESPQISSDNCYGYTTETNPQFVDVWYKKKIQSSFYALYLPLYIYTRDTTHISFYYGTCGNLFQHKCYTLLPGFYDGELIYEFYYEQRIINDGDSLYVQISYPESSLPADFTLIFGGKWLIAPGHYYFNYNRPAIINYLTGVNETKQKEVYVRPNPTQGKFNIESFHEISKLEIFSMNGRLLKTYSIYNKNDLFSIDEFNSGMYILKLKFADNSIRFEKIIKI